MSSFSVVLFLTLAVLPNGICTQFCPPLGAVLPVPVDPSSSSVVNAAARDLTAALDTLIRQDGSQQPPFPFTTSNVTSFSINLRSVHDEGYILDYHHTASIRGDNQSLAGTTTVTGNTVYRVGSISKVFTVLALLLLQEDGGNVVVNLDDPVTKYVPELAAVAAEQRRRREVGESSGAQEIDWDGISLRALMSQLSGLPRDFTFDWASFGPMLPLPGLPPVNAARLPSCGNGPSQRPCSRAEYLSRITERHPVFAPFLTPAYSNAAFDILGMVIESVLNTTYEDALQSEIFNRLGMSHSSVTPPRDSSVGILPIGDNGFWSWDLGASNPAGGLFSSPNDLSKLGCSILNNQLLRPAMTRAWLKPSSSTVSLDFSVGAPWEIYRVSGLSVDGRVIDFYTKGGDLGPYSSILGLVPDYGLVFTIMVAGPDGNLRAELADLLAITMIPAVDKAARQQAATRFGGVYASSCDGSNTSLSLAVDEGPGLNVNEFWIGGQDVLQGLAQIVAPTSSNSTLSMRLYPTGLEQTVPASSNDSVFDTEISFRASLVSVPARISTANSLNGVQGLPGSSCSTWFGYDALPYEGNSLDEFIFRLDPTGMAISVDVRGWQTVLERQIQ